MNTHEVFEAWQLELKNLASQGRLRSFRTPVERSGPWVGWEGKTLLNLSSNDYLGLASDPELNLELARLLYEKAQAQSLPLFGSTASRLMAGAHLVQEELEAVLESLYPGKKVLLYNSGWHVNTGIIPVIVGPPDVIFADRFVHASLVDGWKLSGATLHRYRHNDMGHLEELLKQYRPKHSRSLILTESVFSMDGDEADLSALVDLKRRFDSFLYLDEAHAFGVLGKEGGGLAQQEGWDREVDFLVGTFGKAMGSMGAFVACAEIARNTLIQKSRPLIFSTALPPSVTQSVLFYFGQNEELAERRERLKKLWKQFHQRARAEGILVRGSTWIIPVVLGTPDRAVQLAQECLNAGIWGLPIRPPTVPEGSSRLRLSLRSDIEPAFLEPLWSVLAKEFS
ncbi:MAG: 8-amino-7-oxononanoate synthase [Spirochaetales bacterium]|nr:8-amino-7-oxononanoate synthase [Spirochaetales bacterium]